ncbi:MAG: MBL fold metallo-hydrolase [Gammaproteobacteria bacterium]
MSEDSPKMYLKEEVYFEPLFNQWYAWPYLIPPVTAARFMVKSHKRVMSSFVKNYKLHILAVNQPGMEGSDFLDCREDQVADIQALVADIDEKHADYVALCDAVTELDEMLRNHTSGESIEGFYSRVPEPLRGYVELTMDMEHRPSFRIMESLVYQSKLYRPDLQSVSFGTLSKVAERPFSLSTPRLPDENHIQLPLNFNAPELAEILRARDVPLSVERINDIFGSLEARGGLSHMELFTEQAPSHHHVPVTDGVRLQYTGHAGLMMETADVCVMVDPIVPSRNHLNENDIIGFSQLPEKIDYVCITHNHQDHLCLETLLQLRHKIGKIVVPKNNGGTLPDPSMKLLLKQFGFDVMDVDDFEEIGLPGGRIVSIPFLGEHGDLNIRSKTAWFVDLGGKRVFMGADSSNLDPVMYQHIKDYIGRIDVLTIGMECVGAPYTWIYGSLHTKLVTKKIKESRRLNGSDAEQAMGITRIFDPKAVYLYALGLEPWYKYFMGIGYDENSEQIIQTDKTIAACEKIGIPAQRLYGKHTIDLAFEQLEVAV